MIPWWVWVLLVEFTVFSGVLGWAVGKIIKLRRDNDKLTRAVVKMTTVIMRVNHLSIAELERLMGCQALVDELAVRRRVERES